MSVAVHAFTNGAHDLAIAPVLQWTAGRQVGCDENAQWRAACQEVGATAIQGEVAAAAMAAGAAAHAFAGCCDNVGAGLGGDSCRWGAVGCVQSVGAEYAEDRNGREEIGRAHVNS